MSAALFKIDAQGPVEVWTLCRERSRNAVSREAQRQLQELIEGAIGRPALRCVILTGEGDKAFCAGADLKERRGMSDQEVRQWLHDLRGTLLSIERSPKVFIAAMNGVAFGGGLELALACDLRVAVPSAVMGLTETRLGIIPGGGGTQRLPRLIGAGRAAELILTGARISAERALAMGLLNRVSEAGESAVDAALDLAKEVAACAPLAVAKAKEAIWRGADQSLEEGLETEYQCYQATLDSEDRLEALAAFAEGRPPNFKGR